ncbi:MAG: anaerobic ribonucleoside-triphosphate reductase activating protein [Erysipelotrichaceae bacterium]|uniref:anaerobic ribonucleoside-triphosphate reductase activating protein n=1 Tax=Floccifex sp. TaxID=2815810 RepID=UPI002A74DCA8|nr:anaerobic ribonucleoside-triphosphate reductase activating protein [Floccifex sp.]MDD7280726.1 anaerobic ribonucleoside-triphosphate reductase activating protein [Erysipelotrichaceae bacterium]MDY2958364.1 anaerobic ribonucleoside-triphosphate reductase activating protein [Floccifex sp.]
MKNDLFMDSSILYRTTQKYFDKELSQYQLTYAQLPVLIMVYENEGISMQEIALQGLYDKGTITKNVQKLELLGYLSVVNSNKDKRSKELYTTSKAKEVMSYVYEVRRDWWKQLNANMTNEDIERFSNYFVIVAQNAKSLIDYQNTNVKFYAHQKVNLNMYPNQIATIFYTGGCNFKCKYCQNPELVFLKQNICQLEEEQIYSFLEKRVNTIDAICIAGGEPCMHENLSDFLWYGKSLGYKMCVKTNGSYPSVLASWIEENLLDYVIVNVKNSKKQYNETIGLNEFNIDNIDKTIHYLKQKNVPFYYDITLLKELHTKQDVLEMAKWLQSDVKCRLHFQNFDQEQRDEFFDLFRKYCPNTEIEEI